MKRQSAEEYTKEKVRDAEIPDAETPVDKIEHLIREALKIAEANAISLVAATSEKVEVTGKNAELLTLSIIAAAYVATRSGVPVEKFETTVKALIRPAYEEAKKCE